MGCFFSHSARKVFLDPIKDVIFIMELNKLNKIGRKSTRSGLEGKTQTLHFWNNYSRLVLKNYIGILQQAFPYSVWILRKKSKNSLK